MASVAERLWAKVDKSGDCWLWTGNVTPGGYGRFFVDGHLVGPHRVAYELEVGPIPEGLDIDHRLVACPKNCVTPWHLRIATRKQNNENKAAQKNSQSGIRGVSWSEDRQKWCAYVQHSGRSISAGRYLTIEEAEAAVIAKRNELFTHNDADRMVEA